MIGQRCQRTLRSSEGAKCTYHCDSKCIPKRIINFKISPESGDVGHQGKCVMCQTSKDTTADSSKENLLHIIFALSEKFEIVNKIQLPKLNCEIAQIKNISDYITKQNDDILRKMMEIEKRNHKERKSVHSYRKRNLKLSNKNHIQSKPLEKIDLTQVVSPEKKMRYQTRRRSYTFLLNRMLHILNRKLNRVKTSPRKRHRRN